MKPYILRLLFLASLLICGCEGTPPIEGTMLDGDVIFDPSINDPDQYLVSAQYPNPTAADLDRHVIIAVHGYTASTFEWSEFREWSKGSEYRISQVLLGAHGTTYEDFRASTWADWAESIKLEYETLVGMGYKKISLVGSSTGGTLLLELLRSDYFEKRQAPKGIFLIDPIVVASAKLQSIVGLIGPMIVYVDSEQRPEEDPHWYHFKPYETINELNELMRKVRKGLEEGFSLPRDTYCQVFHSRHDPVANSLSTVMIYKGLRRRDGGKVAVQIMDSDIHVFTRLSLREEVTQKHQDNQLDAFAQIAQKLSE